MDVQGYVVTLGIRPAEMSGLGELPGATKNRLTPIVLLAPWLTAKPLSKALKRFEEAYPNRNYFVDVDENYSPGESPNEAKEQWRQLSQVPADIDFWHELLNEHKYANPCLLMRGRTVESARDQIRWARKHNRAFCVRIILSGSNFSIPHWASELLKELGSDGAVDYAVVFDFRWVPQNFDIDGSNLETLRLWIANIPNEVRVVISFTSFPMEFSEYDGVGICEFNNREVVKKVQGVINRPITYGDWGSAKPRKKNAFGGRAKTRIDFPLESAWLISRDQEDGLSFEGAARRITRSDEWSGNLGIWGEKLIEGAADGLPSIRSIGKMVAARINIHLHRQAFYGQENFPIPEHLDEDWSDDPL